MHPILLHLPSGATISSYGFFMAIAALTGFFGTLTFSHRRGLPVRQVALTLLAMLVAALIGGRFLNVLINRSVYISHPDKIADLGTSGFSLYGGIVFSTLIGWILLRCFRIDTWKFADTGTPVLGASIALMRIGCYLNGCCFGKETDLPWGIAFPVMSQAHRYQLVTHPGNFFTVEPVHPTELYELLAALILASLAAFLIRKNAPTGVPFLSFMILFSLFRLGNSVLRVIPPTFDASPFLYPILYLSFAISGSTLLIGKIRQQTARSESDSKR
ncbi:MAG: prolipoprotein diacylglyceryl transferase [Candidatus Moranbacteria bacterium]|nr:prolipoprotein diacylglyceryl transferase [Candidatus Moranbacteria bacterium]